MGITWTSIQKQRLQELNASEIQLEQSFESHKDRDRAFQEQEHLLVVKGKQKLQELKETTRRPSLSVLEQKLVEALTKEGFVQVVTPTIISKAALAKMSVSDEHPLFSQVFWLDSKRCLRPMLAPNLYTLWKDLERLWEKPIRIFEIGTCYRKESKGSVHLNEFTMLNLAELGVPEDQRHKRLEELASLVMDTAGISDYQLVMESSVVYGDELDVVKGIELGSSAMGPHPLDDNWGIFDPWVGIGFGLERLLMIREGSQNVQSMGRSLTYLNGVRLNI
ncbi:pyrrolysyl-tRNA synthetase, C-terminal region [Desulfosporosinus orientis DSM 765]|uniref:Pyrrolysyl-tRNA synthetase, C-terminal region n=1 Tax=Desulfosporosinus orientis (strain ATCC 19365 / DSM 765 / NCIMB 8382 / VKM B-1628 / Singapore I) TaxID=768706 RepID=G7WET6_DESOD|nr:pyrrolysine--tRNA(Pyl) ligase large subunit [Desulfosporosinus orientis]AET67265.1 pyrrolysyl-tRNA synthetase, C-terminal region [Desulfosporosinus orientis DSM 765]